MEQLAATKDTKIKLKACNQMTVTQLGICTATLEHNKNAEYAISFLIKYNKISDHIKH